MTHEYEPWQIHDGSDECPVPEGAMGQLMARNVRPVDAVEISPMDMSDPYISWPLIFAYRVLKQPKQYRGVIIHGGVESYCTTAPRYPVTYELDPTGKPINIRAEEG